MVSWFDVLRHSSFALASPSDPGSGYSQQLEGMAKRMDDYLRCDSVEAFWKWVSEGEEELQGVFLFDESSPVPSAGSGGGGDSRSPGAIEVEDLAGGRIVTFVLFSNLEERDQDGHFRSLVGFKEFNTVGGPVIVDIADLMRGLKITAKAKRVTTTRSTSGGAKAAPTNSFVPTIEGMVEKRHQLLGRFNQKAGDHCASPESLTARPSSIFIPFAFWSMIDSRGGTEDEGKVTNNLPHSGHMSARLIADKLVELFRDPNRSGTGAGNNPQAADAKRLKAMGQIVLDFLWASQNQLTSGVQVRPSDGSVKCLSHYAECIRALEKLDNWKADKPIGDADKSDEEPKLKRRQSRSKLPKAKTGREDFDSESTAAALDLFKIPSKGKKRVASQDGEGMPESTQNLRPVKKKPSTKDVGSPNLRESFLTDDDSSREDRAVEGGAVRRGEAERRLMKEEDKKGRALFKTDEGRRGVEEDDQSKPTGRGRSESDDHGKNRWSGVMRGAIQYGEQGYFRFFDDDLEDGRTGRLGDTKERARGLETGDDMDTSTGDYSGHKSSSSGRRDGEGSMWKRQEEESTDQKSSPSQVERTRGPVLRSDSKLPPLPRGRSSVPPQGSPTFDQIPQRQPNQWPGGYDPTSRPYFDQELLANIARSQVVMAEVSQKMQEATVAARARENKKDDSKKIVSKWTTENQKVFRVLCAEDGWDSGPGLPSYSDFVDGITEKTVSKTLDVVRAKAIDNGWPGCILREGLSQFLRRGLGNTNKTTRPEAFSVLFFHSADVKEEDDPDFDAQHVRETFNEKKEMTEQVIKAVSKNKIFFPAAVHQAKDMLECVIMFLELICGRRTISTGSYREGLNLINRNRRTFEIATQDDKAFLVRFLSLLDREFQNFHRSVATFAGDEDPIGDLLDRGKRTSMEDQVRQLLSPWLDYSYVFGFRAPSDIEAMLSHSHSSKGSIREVEKKSDHGGGSSSNSGRSSGRGSRTSGDGTPSDKGEDEPSWWLRLPEEEKVQGWAIPTGKKFREYFGQGKRGNTSGMPYFKHHKRTGKSAQICLKHQITKDCLRGGSCDFAHVRPRDISTDKHKVISEKLREVYRKEGPN